MSHLGGENWENCLQGPNGFARDIAEERLYHLLYLRARSFWVLAALATVLGQMLLQAGDGHGHLIRQLPFFGGREFAEPHEVSHSVTRLLELAFEPSMFRAANCQGRRGAHQAPVENAEEENSK